MKRRAQTKTVEDVEKIARQQREELAYHEAGRCVAAVEHGLAIKFVSLSADSTAGAHISRAIHLAADNPAAQIAAIESDIVVVLAGPSAQRRLRPWKRNFPECGDDLQLARAWGSWAAFLASGMSGANVAELKADGLIELTEEEKTFADCLLNACEERAHRIVAEHWANIIKIAEALLVRPVLNSDDIDAILNEQPKPRRTP
jgi:hypothetical protein